MYHYCISDHAFSESAWFALYFFQLRKVSTFSTFTKVLNYLTLSADNMLMGVIGLRKTGMFLIVPIKLLYIVMFSIFSRSGSWFCNCPPGYTGTLCERPVCETNPCRFGGTCLGSKSGPGFLCLCPVGRSGSLCQNGKAQSTLCFEILF